MFSGVPLLLVSVICKEFLKCTKWALPLPTAKIYEVSLFRSQCSYLKNQSKQLAFK